MKTSLPLQVIVSCGKNVAVFTTNLCFLSCCCYKSGDYLLRGSHDRFFLDVKFFRLLLGAVPEVIYSIGEDKSSLCLSGSTSDDFNI